MLTFSERMKLFVSDYQTKNKNLKFSYLVLDFLHSFRFKDYWEDEIFPLLKNIKNKSLITDWNSFDWEGKICFRHNYVMILDKSIYQNNSFFPPILDLNGNALVDESGQWLENTDYIEQNYTEFFKITLDEFTHLCNRWYDEVLLN